MSQPNPVQTFLIEADDLLAVIEEIALDADPGSPDSEAINRLFRAFHTIKGSGAMFGFDAVAAFTHHVESALDKVRDGSLALSQELLNLVLEAKDQIKGLLEFAQGGAPVTAGSGEKIIQALQALSGESHHSAPSTQEASQPISSQAEVSTSTPTAGGETFRIRFRPERGIIASGTNPVALLNELRGLGECQVVAQLDQIPPIDQLQPDQCYTGWEIVLTTSSGRNAIKDVFIFVEDCSELVIESSPASPASVVSAKQAVATAPASTAKATAPSPALAAAPKPVSTSHPAPTTPAATPAGSGAPANSGSGGASAARKPATKDSTVRVPSEKLDRLVNLVGELVMNQSRLTAVASRLEVPDLAVPVEEIERLVAELRDNVLGIRMMPIGTTFSRFKRLVHDLSAELGKEIDLVTEGAETELDKTVLDQLGDPLVHLIRNSIDHGVEPSEVRQRNGKPARGTIRLTATHTGSNVVVSIQDDGKGLDTHAIREKALEKKLIPADANLSEKEIFNLIFLPGFSTAKQITSVSGRGVGMDVVKRQIDSLRGSVSITSELGKGTTISLTLPLTLAIIDGLLVEIAQERFIIPMSLVTENVELSASERHRNNGRNAIAVRGELIPYIRLRELFGSREDGPEVEKIVVVRHECQRVGLVVDRVLGSHQTVIQSLSRFYRNVEIVSGATIMGDGRVALIVDLGGLVRTADAATKNALNHGAASTPYSPPVAA